MDNSVVTAGFRKGVGGGGTGHRGDSNGKINYFFKCKKKQTMFPFQKSDHQSKLL